MTEGRISYESDADSRFVRNRLSNVKSDLIEITEDKLENILLKYLQNLELRKRWLLPFGLLMSLALTLTTAKFQDALGVPAAVWNAIFITLAALSLTWLMVEIVNLSANWKTSSLSYLLKRIKNAQAEHQ